jgi:hypothetical protein
MTAALLWGCLNTVSVPGAGQEMTEQAAGGREAPDSFTVMVLAKGTPGDSDSRSMTGQNAENVMATDSLRNIIQLIVVDSAGKVASFSESRRDGDSTDTVSFNVNLPAGEVYHFLLLQGHWPYQGEKESYGYLAGPPTLLTAGFASSMIASGNNPIYIKQQILATDIAFVPAAGSGFKQVEPRTGREALLVPGRWSLNWTVRKGRVENGEPLPGAAGNGFEALLEARKALNPFAADPGFKGAQRSLNGAAAKSDDLSVTGNLASLDLDLAMNTGGFVNFNLEYAPFGLSGSGAGWSEYQSDLFDLNEGGPVWIIRNGLNDAVQDGNTDFSKVGDQASVGFYNGNGAVSYRVLDPAADGDGDGIGNEQEIKWGTDPGDPDNGDEDSDGDGFSDKMEADNGFNPQDKEDNPGKAFGLLTVSGAKELGTRKGPAATISFVAEGYAGIAKGYYKVEAKGEPVPAYGDYAAFELEETDADNSGAQTLTVGLPAEPEDAWKAAYDVYILLLHDRKASLPARVSLPEMTTNTIGVGGW